MRVERERDEEGKGEGEKERGNRRDGMQTQMRETGIERKQDGGKSRRIMK